MSRTKFNPEKLAQEYSRQSPVSILKFALGSFDDIAISFSGAEDVILIDMATKIKADINVFSLDTGRLHAETYRFIDRVREHYHIKINILFPDAEPLEELVRNKGLYSFYRDGHQECCDIRKLIPLRKKLSTLSAWITGQRKDQSPDTRLGVPVIEHDTAFSTAEHEIIKFNPLANWSSAEVWEYIKINNVPYNPLHEQGYTSIGCEPCTRPILPAQHEREGRWWWEDATKKECGLHVSDTKK